MLQLRPIHAISPLTVAPLAPRKNSTSSGPRQEGVLVVRSATSMRKMSALPKTEGAGEVAVHRLGKTRECQITGRAPSCSLEMPHRHPEHSLRELSLSFSLDMMSQRSPFAWGSTAAKYRNLVQATCCRFKLKLVVTWVHDSQSMVARGAACGTPECWPALTTSLFD